MLTNLVIDVPVPQDGARPLLEKDDEDNANLLVRDITWIYWLDDVRKQAVANFLCSNYTNLFRLQVITEGSFIAPPDVSGQSAALYFQTPPSDAHGISNTPQVNHSTPAFSTAPYSTVNYDGSIDRHGSHDQTYSDIFNDLITLPDEDSALEKAKKDTDPRYHGGLEIMQNYGIPSNSSLNLTKISLAIRAGYAIIRPDLEIFTKTILSRWLRNGLWPTLNSARSQSDDIKVQCSEDMMYLGIEKDPETKTMLRRIARIRLYYWYEEEKKKIQHSQVPMELDRGIDIRTRSIDVFLEYFHADWENAEEERRKYFRSRFHIEKNIGKRWCELVQYLGEGILVICGKEMDTQMNSNNFPKDNVHALATFVSNCYSEAVQVSQCFIPVVKSFIRKGIFEEQEFTQWNSQLDWDFMGTALEKVKSPPSHQGAWTTFPDLSKTDLTRFIREALI